MEKNVIIHSYILQHKLHSNVAQDKYPLVFMCSNCDCLYKHLHPYTSMMSKPQTSCNYTV